MPLSDKQQNAIPLLLAGERYGEIAKKVGVNRDTLWTWKQAPEFIAEYNRQRAEIQEETKQALAGLVKKAIEVLQAEMTAKEAMEIIKLYGADFSLDDEPGETDTEKIEADAERREARTRENRQKARAHELANDAFYEHGYVDKDVIAKKLRIGKGRVKKLLADWIEPIILSR